MAGSTVRALALGHTLVSAAAAANAARPFGRADDAGVASFFAGFAVSELPLATLAAQSGVNLGLAAAGGFRGRTGVGSALLAGASAATLVGLHRVARGAAGTYEDALTEALGAGYRERIVHPHFPGPDAATAKAPGAARMLRIRRRFALDPDQAYGPAGRANLLDVWHRADLPRDGAAPVLVQVPGGAWISGNKQGQAYPLMSHLAERGWICVSLSYRLSPRNTWPAQIVDVKRALAWVRGNIAGFGGDPGFVAITGGSAGGHLSSLAALTPNVPEWQPGFEDADTSVVAAAPFYGAFDWVDDDGVGNPGLVRLVARRVVKSSPRREPQLFRDASPVFRVNADAPPFLVSHGTNDSLIPVEQGRRFVRALRAVSANPVGWAELPLAQHAFDVFGSVRASAAAEAVGRFLGVVYGDHLRRTGSA